MRRDTIRLAHANQLPLRDCKALLVTGSTHVSGAIATVQTFTTFIATECSKMHLEPFAINFFSRGDTLAPLHTLHGEGRSKESRSLLPSL